MVRSTTPQKVCPFIEKKAQMVPGLERELQSCKGGEMPCQCSDGQVQAWANGKTKESREV